MTVRMIRATVNNSSRFEDFSSLKDESLNSRIATLSGLGVIGCAILSRSLSPCFPYNTSYYFQLYMRRNPTNFKNCISTLMNHKDI